MESVNPKVVIVLLVLVVVLFALAVGVGATRPAGSAGGDGPDWLQSLGARLGARQALRDEDISGAIGACPDHLQAASFALPAGLSCTWFFKDSSAPVRTLSLELAAGDARAVFDPYGEGEMTLKQDLTGDRRTMRVPVTKAGGQLGLVCLAGSCQFVVK